jgi:ferredoxin
MRSEELPAGAARAVTATVDDVLCVRSGTCVAVARGLFALGARHAEFVPEQSDDVARVTEAAESCPTAAIAVHDARSGASIFP